MATSEDAATATTNQATRRSGKLTEVSVERMKPPAIGRVQIADAVVTGLWLRITANGAKSWSVVYRPKGTATVRRITLGRWRAFSVKDARDLAKDILLRVARGEDPAASAGPPATATTIASSGWRGSSSNSTFARAARGVGRRRPP